MDKKQEIGIFRFSIIAPMINDTHGFDKISEYLDFVSSKNYVFNGKTYKFTKSCIRNWYTNYKKYGITSLEGKTRNDNKTSRKLSYEAIERISELRISYPCITGTAIYKTLIKENYIKKNDISLSTILRYIKKNNLKKK